MNGSDQHSAETDIIPLSALNHWAYCPRRCGLIHMEGEFEDNVHTVRGQAEHERVDQLTWETGKSGARVEYALPVWSDRLGLIGRCDVVEFRVDGSVYPVEFKHGPRRKWLNDDLQLAAQALCLEEMLGRSVPRGAIYHASSRRRREVEITAQLRRLVEESVAAVRAMLASGVLPAPADDGRCRECSLNALCQPHALARRDAQRLQRAALYSADCGVS